MKVLILDGASILRELADPVRAALERRLEAGGHAITCHDLTALEIPDCKGDFGCWTVTPGRCIQAGPHRDLARDLVESDRVVFLTPVTFGGYSSTLKSLLDHSIPLVFPLMSTVDGETHHDLRYPRFPELLAIGLAERPDPSAARVFARLVRRNALNMHAPRFASGVLTRGDLPGLEAWLGRRLEELAASPPPRPGGEPLELGARRDLSATPPRRALLVIGSPRPNSVSAALAAHLGELLASRGLAVTTERLHGRSRDDPGLRRLAESVAAADVVALATPLYVDSLPAPVTEALELLAHARAAALPARARFLALVNCGFPEAVHTDTAVAICRTFAREADLDWIGGLGIGGGGMLAGKPLAAQGGRARFVTRALELTADAIVQGRIVPDEALQLVRRLPIPAWLYRRMADWGFRREAKRHGTGKRLGERRDTA